MSGAFQRATAWVNLGAVTRNCERLREGLGEGVELCAVVKANGYGHGIVECARAAVSGGAGMLAVAAASEAFELRESLADTPVLTMGALTDAELDVALSARSELGVWREGFLETVAERGSGFGLRPRIHVKYDTGMGRLGEREAANVERLLGLAAEDPRVELAGLWTHFATADERDSGFFDEQLDRFVELADRARATYGDGLLIHAANSAATLREPRSHFDMVRCGIAVYGLDPFGADPRPLGLEPVMGLSSYVAAIKRFEPGDSAGYGRTWRADRDTFVGVVPIGYGDGVRRGLSNRARGPDRGRALSDRRHDLDGQPHRRPRPRALGRPRRGGRPARRLRRGRGQGRGVGPAPRDDQLRDLLRRLAAGAEDRPPLSAPRLEDALAAAPLVARAREAAADLEVPVWIVGGAVRDALLGRPLTDMDLATPGPASTVAHHLSKALGGKLFELSDEFDTWRVVGIGDGGGEEGAAFSIDVAALRADSIEADLALRDFTVNAIAVPLSPAAPVEAIDPSGGIADLEARRLRVVSARSFDDDPLRLMRAGADRGRVRARAGAGDARARP